MTLQTYLTAPNSSQVMYVHWFVFMLVPASNLIHTKVCCNLHQSWSLCSYEASTAGPSQCEPQSAWAIGWLCIRLFPRDSSCINFTLNVYHCTLVVTCLVLLWIHITSWLWTWMLECENAWLLLTCSDYCALLAKTQGIILLPDTVYGCASRCEMMFGILPVCDRLLLLCTSVISWVQRQLFATKARLGEGPAPSLIVIYCAFQVRRVLTRSCGMWAKIQSTNGFG